MMIYGVSYPTCTKNLEWYLVFMDSQLNSLINDSFFPFLISGDYVMHEKWFLNTNLFLIKPFLIVKFDCNTVVVT